MQVQQQYEYFAILTEARPSLEDPASMCRRWVADDGQVHEEAFTTDLVWAPSTALRSASGADEVQPVDEEAAVRFQDSLRDRVSRSKSPDGQPYTYVAWMDNGSLDDPDGVLRTWTEPNGYNAEQRYIPGTGWRDSYIREDWHRGRYDGDFEVIDQATAEQIIQRWEQRRAEQG